jgi:hypothetical protein
VAEDVEVSGEFKVTLADGTVASYPFDSVDASVSVIGLGQLVINTGHGVVAAYGPGEWKRFERFEGIAKPAWWPNG